MVGLGLVWSGHAIRPADSRQVDRQVDRQADRQAGRPREGGKRTPVIGGIAAAIASRDVSRVRVVVVVVRKRMM